MKRAIEYNTAEICRLKKAIDDTVIHRSEGPDAFNAWVQACDEFHAHFDILAFPGGLTSALERLTKGDMLTAETAIIFLEMHPYFFRSQYIGTMLIRRLKKLQLRPDLKSRFDAVREAARQRKLRSRNR